jgi:hypothetical protein
MLHGTRDRSLAHRRRTALSWLAVGLVLSVTRGALSEPSESGGSFRVIVNPENEIRSISRELLANAFLRNVRDWDNGVGIQPVDLLPGSPIRADFSQRILLRSVAAVRSYWQQRIFSGRGVPPPELESDAAVVRYVIGNRGAVGYVSKSTELGAARVIAVH